jgi:hypothetical protein
MGLFLLDRALDQDAGPEGLGAVDRRRAEQQEAGGEQEQAAM